MYKDGNASLPPSPQHTPPTTGAQVDQPVGFRPIEKRPPANQTAERTQVSHSQAMNILDSTGQAIHQPTFISIVDLGTLTSSTNQAIPQFQSSGMPVSFASTTQVRSDILAPVGSLQLDSGFQEGIPDHPAKD